MNNIKEYLITICVAALLCGIINKIMPQKGGCEALIKLLCGLFMLITFLSPMISFPIFDFEAYFSQLTYEAESIVAAGEDSANDEINRVMQQNVQTHIQNIAKQIGVDVDVEVSISKGLPCSVHVYGAISPYKKLRLSQYMHDQLGILPEDQFWNI